MFCEKCGTQLPDTAAFCTNCGASVAKTKNIEERLPDTEIQLRVEPSFKFGYIILTTILPPLMIYGILLLISLLPLFMLNIGMGIATILICFGILVITLGIKTIINKKQYDNICYDFYKTKVIYKDSFLNLSEKEVKYKYIREVTMKQTLVQRYFNIGNIILFTNAESGHGNGICIVNVENVQDVYRNIKSITRL